MKKPKGCKAPTHGTPLADRRKSSAICSCSAPDVQYTTRNEGWRRGSGGRAERVGEAEEEEVNVEP